LQFESRTILFTGLMLQGTARATIMTVLVLALVELPGVGDRYAGTAAGLFFAAAEFGGMLGPLAIGMLYDLTGGFTVALAICTLITAGLLFGARRLNAMARQVN
jgi:MFS transporter, CP family, cyanate transporter